jgi:DNA-binding transcriptional ArsR family regulator
MPYNMCVDRMLRALADETRRHIVALVWRQERTAGQIAAEFPVSRPAISQHLSVLLTAELITLRRAGTRRLYRANRRALARLRAQLGAFWDNRLEQLKDATEAAERKRRRN